MEKKDKEIFTDGSVLCNGKKGGALGGIGIYSGDYGLSIAKSYPNATNNIMELAAIRDALDFLIEKDIHESTVIYSDSMYSIKCCTAWYKTWDKNGWLTSNKKPVKNKDLIIRIMEQLKSLPNARLSHVKGHSNVEGNERADRLARSVHGK